MARKKHPDGIRPVTLANGKERFVVTGYDPHRGGGSKEIGRRDTLKEAKQLKRDFEAGKNDRLRAVTTCDEWVEVWTTDPNYARPSASTNRHNAERVRVFGRDFAGVPLHEVTRPLARAWIMGGRVPAEFAERARTWQGAMPGPTQVVVPTRKGNRSAVRAMFTDAMLAGLIESNPFTKLRIPGTGGRQQITPLTREEVDELVSVAGRRWGDWGRTTYAALILTAAYTGMRPGELFGLMWDSIDFERAEIDVQFQLTADGRQRPKNKRARTIVLPERPATALRQVPRSTDGLVFQTRRGKPFTARKATYYWDPIRSAFAESRPADHWLRHRMEQASGDDGYNDGNLDFYELRHFCGSFLADRGATAQDIALQLGHTDNGVVAQQVYIHTYVDHARDRLRLAFGEPIKQDDRRRAG